MKQFLRILLAVSIIAFSASITAVSCGKTPDAGGGNNANNNNPGSGGDGGDGNGGGGTPAEPAIVIENVDATVAEVKNGTDIELKASGFPTAAINANIANTTLATLATAPANTIKRAFDIVIKGTGGAAATGGLVLVDIGSRANANAFSTDAINKALTSYMGTDLKEGLRNSAPRAADAANAEAAKMGWNIYGGFMDDTTPTSGATDATPFAFTATTGAGATHPVLFCRTTVSTITDGGNAGNGTAQDATVLTGGQKASCYIGSVGQAFTSTAANAWLTTVAGNTFKKKFDFAAAGIKTDAKTIGTMGLTGGSAMFRDGLTTAEMAMLTAANESAFKKFSVSLVRDAGFTYTTPEITLQNFDAAAAKLVAGGVGGATDTIRLKASAFPTVNADNNRIGDIINDLPAAPTGSLRRIFDITITGGTPGAATGGLIMVGRGNVASVNGFSESTGVAMNPTTAVAKTDVYITGQGGNVTQHVYRQPGWNHYGNFKNADAPTANDPNAVPFSFSPVPGGSSTLPIMFCRTTLSQITSTVIGGPVTFAGGQTASCYIGTSGFDTFNAARQATWLGTAASATFKKTFNIAIGGIRTDGKTADEFMPGATDPAKRAALEDGLSSAEITAITAANPSAYRKVSVTMVSDANF